MNLVTEIKELKKEIDEIDDPKLILLIRNLLQYGKEKPEERISIEQYNQEIDEAVARYKKGKYISHDAVKEMSKNW